MIEQEFETPGTALLHYGVAGMKWGKSRAQASTVQIKSARSRVYQEKEAFKKADKKAAETRDAGERAVKNLEVKKMKTNLLKNPDRVIANRLTRGEKAVFGLWGLASGGVLPLAAIGATSATSRRIERKQELNKY